MHRTARVCLWLAEAKNSLPILVALLLALALCSECTGQTVRIEAQERFDGWLSTTVDHRPKYREGIVTRENGDVVPFVVGRAVGLDTMVVDLQVHLAAGERVALDLSRALPAKPQPVPLPDLGAFFGGWPAVNGQAMVLKEFAGDGAALTSHWRVRTGAMLCTDLWLRWYPAEAWMRGEVRVTASNPTVPDLFAPPREPNALPLPAVVLTFGDARVFVTGAGFEAPVVPAGTTFADGQARAVPVTFVWSRNLTDAFAPSVQTLREGKVQAVGITQLLADGNPVLPAGFNAVAWADSKRAGAEAVLHTWGAPLCGPSPRSTNTGEQEDQFFVRGEVLLHERAAWVTYLSALKLSNRPCHHLEANGDLLSLTTHPGLRMWQMRQFKPSVCPDQLGKSTSPFGDYPGLADWDVPGQWWGADDQHLLFNTLAAACRITGRPALQCELSTVARNYLYDHPLNSGSGGSRAWGYEGFFAVHCWRELEDRVLAQLVADRWRARFDRLKGDLGNYEVFQAESLGPGRTVQGWQEAVKDGGQYHAGLHLGRPEACTMAIAHAKRVVADGFVRTATGWTTRNAISLDGYPMATGLFDHFGYPMAVAVAMKGEVDATLQSIADWLAATSTLPKHTVWNWPQKVR